MNINSDYEALNLFVRDKLRSVHTIKPAVVLKNNGHTVNVRPLTTTRYRDGTQLPIGEIPDVPLMIYAGTKGNARITVPVVEGDTVMLLCSDRDYGSLLESSVDTKSIFPSDDIQPMELFPIMAIPMFFTEPEGKPIDTENIVIENGTTTITVKPSGDIDIYTPANINVNTGGDANISVEGSATIDVAGPTSLTTASLDVTAPMSTFNGNVAVVGNLTTSGTAGIGGALTAKTIDSDTTSLENHTHDYMDGSTRRTTYIPNTN